MPVDPLTSFEVKNPETNLKSERWRTKLNAGKSTQFTIRSSQLFGFIDQGEIIG